ncbi:conserved hypothetical protein [Gloeothece citriformis PCC 7424]|uniref:Uncharacterized protein n=1 Tax=Gloeothece citriformis (strain PCC 7424) TaxID=65393 RepID=B7KL38_GLOC7|nr:hypothetical protein [Gloeothece citriformis]ACK72410.1 conserved hypothetical protein [Gloeothece citriformis PCC 7424]
MKISDLENILAQIKAEQGDLPIVYRSRHQQATWLEEIRLQQLRILKKTSSPKLLIII